MILSMTARRVNFVSTARSWRVVLGTDAAGLEPNATLVASLLRHTAGPVEVRLWPGEVDWLEPRGMVNCAGLRVEEIADHIREAERAGVGSCATGEAGADRAAGDGWAAAGGSRG